MEKRVRRLPRPLHLPGAAVVGLVVVACIWLGAMRGFAQPCFGRARRGLWQGAGVVGGNDRGHVDTTIILSASQWRRLKRRAGDQGSWLFVIIQAMIRPIVIETAHADVC